MYRQYSHTNRYNYFTDWSNTAARDLGWVLQNLFPTCKSQPPFRITLNLPSKEQARDVLEKNRNLTGSITITWHKKPAKPFILTLPLPFHGVFLRRNRNGKKALSYIWIPYLGEAPGFRLIKKYSKTKKGQIWWKLGLMHGRYLEGLCERNSTKGGREGKKENKKLYSNTQFLAQPEHYPEEIKGIFESSSFIEARIGTSAKTITLSKIDSVKDKLGEIAIQLLERKSTDVLDEDDLSHKILVTFPVWLRGRICSRILEEVLAQRSETGRIDGINQDVVKILIGKENTTEEIQKETWNSLLNKRHTISQSIVPFQSLLDEGRVAYIEPENPVDMAALLTRFQRSSFRSDILGKLPPIYRQNHPSFKGLVCPVQSPETERVGITLHLSRQASRNIDSNGLLKIDDEAKKDDELGFGAGLVPFYHHNDGARNMMGAKNLRQAVPLVRRDRPVVTTGGENEITKIVKPLVDIGICPDTYDGDGNLALGKDLLVAYLPWNGMNFEDAIVVGSQVIERGDLDTVKEKVYRHEIKQGWVPSPLGWNTVFPFDGLAKKGTRLVSGSLIASFTKEGGEDRDRYEIKYSDRSPATIKDISFERTALWTSGILEYTLEKEFPLRVGDKLMGRHGNKGVIGAIISEDKMPRLPDDNSIPEKFRGKAIDILLNPHGVISRMNIGQLLETHIGWLLHCGVDIDDLLLPEYRGKEEHIGRAFFQGIDHDKVQELLKQYGLDRYGRVKLTLPDGSKTISPVVVGFQHIVRLKHIPELKIQARRGGVEARYSAGTGQAVHGRSRGGGQKVGEMEVWALAAHRAHNIIEEMLGVKSDVVLVNSLAKGEGCKGHPSFLSRLQDRLFALLINMECGKDGIRFSFIEPHEVKRKINESKIITNKNTFEKKISASFVCQQGGKKGCEYRLLDGRKISVLPTKGTATRNLTIRFEDLLESVGYRRKGPLIEEEGGRYSQRLIRLSDNRDDGKLLVSFDNSGDTIKGVVNPSEENPPERWPGNLQKVYLRGRFQKEKGVNYTAQEIMKEMVKDKGHFHLGRMQIACPTHKTSLLKGKPPFNEHLVFSKSGLYDPKIFGSLDSAGIEKEPRWGIIELPVSVPYPVSAFLGKSETSKVKSPVDIRFLPVLPLRYRLPMKGGDGYIEDELMRKGYRPILELCLLYKRAEDEKKREQYEKQLNYQVYKLFKMMADMLKGKEGLIRRDGLGRRVDLSARLVITPDPSLRWDQAGIPTPVLVELLGEELIEWAANELEYEDIANELLRSLGLIERTDRDQELNEPEIKVTTELLKNWSWEKGEKGEKVMLLFHDMLVKFFDSHRDLVIILNRQPSLHRDSMEAFYPVPLKTPHSDVLRLSPLVCKGFGADFDGDEMTVHMPFTKEAREEAKKLLPSNNMLSVANGRPLAHFDQDFVLGNYWLAHDASGKRNKFMDIFPDDCCKNLIASGGMKKDAGERLLYHLIEMHKEQAPEIIWHWMNLAFQCCTQMGVSFGFYDLRELSMNIKNKRNAINNNMPKGKDGSIDVDKLNELYQDIGNECLGIVIKKSDMNSPGMQLAAMALSGARGTKQIRQLLAARGFLSPGEIPFEASIKRFIFTSPLVEGMDPEQAFYAAMNARSSICDKKLGTPGAGYLTRKLVFALWPYFVTDKKDCGSSAKTRNPLTCKVKNGFCAECYGRLPDGELPKNNFPAGLIAAQSIGERGTQLSMQSFHTGAKVFNIDDVDKMLNNPDLFSDIKKADDFIRMLKGIKAYKDIDDRHFHVLWRAIFDSAKKTLRSAAFGTGPLSRMAFESQKKAIFEAALEKLVDPVSDPVAKVITNSLRKSP